MSLKRPFAAFPCYEGVSFLRKPSLNNRRYPPLPRRKEAITTRLKILPLGANMEGRLGLGETPRLRAGLTSLCRRVVGLCIGLHRNSEIKNPGSAFVWLVGRPGANRGRGPGFEAALVALKC